MDYIPHTYDVGTGENRFQFIDVDSLPANVRSQILDFCSNINCPKVDGFENTIFTWDYYKWIRKSEEIDSTTQSINKRGLGYCNSCGKRTKFTKADNRWQCDSCGYFNRQIGTRASEKVNTNPRKI